MKTLSKSLLALALVSIATATSAATVVNQSINH